MNMYKHTVTRTRRFVAIAAFVLSTVSTVFAAVTRSPDATSSSSVGSINTTVGDFGESASGEINTTPCGLSVVVR